MKRFVLLLSFLFAMHTLFGQSWAQIDATWTYTENYGLEPGEGPFMMQCTQDTMFQGRLCKLLDYLITYADSNGIVYYYDSATSFQILFNINALPGQQWVNYPDGYLSGDSITTIVDSIFTISLNDINLKAISVHYTSVGSYYYIGDEPEDTIIQYIGNTNFIFPWIFDAYDGPSNGPLRCYSDSSIGFVDFHTAPSCDFATAIDQAKASVTVQIFPNPVNESLNLRVANTGEFSLKIFDLMGNAFGPYALRGDEFSLPVQNLAAGMYLFRLLTKKGESE